jgi:DNA repair protein RecN (Recombination protein N)
MLLNLRLRDFVIVDELGIDFSAGFTALTGETGAGKSILLDALALATGGRADASVVREGGSRADIVASFRSDDSTDAWLAERSLDGDPGIVMLRRVIESDGRSRALINGHPATATLLRELGDRLLEVHGQHASQTLLRPEGQRMLLDAFAGCEAEARATADAWARWKQATRELELAQSGHRELEQERERLDWETTELERLRPVPGEWELLNDEQKRLAHAASLIQGASGAAESLSGSDESLARSLAQVIGRLRPLASIDARLAEATELLDSALIQIGEAASSLSAYAQRVDLDPERLAIAEQRIGALFDLARRLRLAPEALAGRLDDVRARLAQIDTARDIESLTRRESEAAGQYARLAETLSAKRQQAAAGLAHAVSGRLAELGMAGGRLDIAFEPSAPGPGGTDRIEFRVAAHPGASPRSLARVASGGELSRISLAISVLAAQANPVGTLIFDEADAGVGGAVADSIGRLMRALGEDRQVLCVTHLPQVAARAHHHLRVSKERLSRSGAQDTTVSRVHTLDAAARIEEIARMLGGAKISATTRRHARELLAGD